MSRLGSRSPARARRDHTTLRSGRARGAGEAAAPVEHPVLGLQRLIGNSATVALLGRSEEPAEPRSSVRRAISGPGAPLDALTRRTMHSHLGDDLSGVQVHVDRASPRSISAAAYTVGSHVVIDPDRVSPGTPEGDHVIAHELTHVVQQRRGPVTGTGSADDLSISEPGDRHEQEAERSAQAYDQGASFTVSSSPAAGRAAGVGRDGSAVQRFPASVLSAPINWSRPKPSVYRPGEGMSGGIYILTAREMKPEVQKVVVKPIFGGTQYGESGESLQFGDDFLRAFGVNTPVSRVVPMGTPEYRELVTLIKPAQPPPTGEIDLMNQWWDITEARSLVVMSEVPKARNAKSFAEKAATDESARNDLFGAVFQPSFFRQLARLAVGDLMIGNPDRITQGKVNIANVMISVAEGKSGVYAIDTGAILPKARPPKDVLQKGGYGGGWDNNTVGDFKHPDKILRDFFNSLAGYLKDATPTGLPEGAPAPWEAFQQEWDARQEAAVELFLQEWQAALSEVHDFVRSEKVKELTAKHEGTGEESRLSYQALKTNATYLSGRGGGQTHEQSVGVAAAYEAYKQLSSLDLSTYDQVGVGEIRPWAAGRPRDAIFGAHLDAIAGLPNWGPLLALREIGSPTTGIDLSVEQLFLEARSRVNQARSAFTGEVGTKRSKGGDVTRNRTYAANYVADALLEGIGAKTTGLYYKLLTTQMDRLTVVTGGNLPPEKLAAVAPVAEALLRQGTRFDRLLDEYRESLAEAAQNVKKMKKYKDRSGLSTMLSELARTSGEARGDRAAEVERLSIPNILRLLRA